MSNDAFGNRESSGIWCGVANGKITRRAEAGQPGAVAVLKVDKKGEPVLTDAGEKQYYYQYHNDRVTGRIIGIKRDVDKFGDVEIPKIVVTIWHPSAGKINLQIKEGNKYWMGMMNALLNVDVLKDVAFEPYDYVRRADGKKLTGMGLKQEGQAVPWRWNKESTDGPPALDHVKLADGSTYMENGKPKWHWQPIITWMHENVVKVMQAKVVDALVFNPIVGVVAEQQHEEEPVQAAAAADDGFPSGDDTEDPAPF